MDQFYLLDKRVEFLIDERLHRFGANIARGREFGQHVQGVLFGVRIDDENTVVLPHCPVLAHNLDAGFLCQPVEGMSATGGFLDVLCTLFGEPDERDVSGHIQSFRFSCFGPFSFGYHSIADCSSIHGWSFGRMLNSGSNLSRC